MQNLPAAGGAPAATTNASGQPLSLPGSWALATFDQREREELLGPACESDAGRQFARCFARWPRALEHVRLVALRALAANRPVDPNDPDVWRGRDEHAQAILRRHGLTRLSAGRLTLAATGALIAGQSRADRSAGLDWSTVAVPPASLDERLRQAHSSLPISLEDPRSTRTAASSATRSRDGSACAARRRTFQPEHHQLLIQESQPVSLGSASSP